MAENRDSKVAVDAHIHISCVIPTFNRSDRLLAAIGSVMNQTQPVDEIIVVDDGSTDGTPEVLKQLQRERPELPLIVLRQDNRGPATARNAGIRQARSEYVAFLDDDDIWLPAKLARQKECLIAFPTLTLLGCATDTLAFVGDIRLVPIKAWNLVLRNWFLTPGVIARRDVLLTCGGFPEDMRCCEDYATWLLLAEHHQCALLNEILVVCGHGKPSFGASGLSRDLVELYAGERKALRRWRDARRAGLVLQALTEGLAAARHWRRRLTVALRNS